MRLLAIGHSYVVRENRSIVREIAREGSIQITVAAPRFFHGDLRPISIEDEPPGSPLDVVPIAAQATAWVHLFRYDARTVRRLLGDGDFDLVDVWEEPYIYAGYQLGRLAARAGVPFSVWTMQNIGKRYPPPFAFFERATVRRAEAWIACGDLVRGTMVSRGYPASRGHVLPLAVDPDVFRPLDPVTRAAVIAELGLTPPVVGFTGRLVASKGVNVLMKALERMPAGQPWSLLVLGSGPSRPALESWAARRVDEHPVRVKLVRHGEVARYLGAIDVLVAPSETTPSWREQFGRMLIEAMACGVPIITSDSGEIPHVVGDAARIVGEGDVDGFARAISETLANSSERGALARRGLDRVQRYTVSVVADQYRDLYRSLVARTVRA